MVGGEPAVLQVVDTLGGRVHLCWDEDAATRPQCQLVIFAEFLAATGMFERWVQGCPQAYRNGKAPAKRDVLGTLMPASSRCADGRTAPRLATTRPKPMGPSHLPHTFLVSNLRLLLDVQLGQTARQRACQGGARPSAC